MNASKIPIGNFFDKVTVGCIERVYIRNARLFSQALRERVLPNFSTLEVEAKQLGEDLYVNSQNEYEADSAFEISADWFVSMSRIKQSMLNLHAVGLRHLFEQQIYDLTYVARIDEPFKRKSDNPKDKRPQREKVKLRYADFEYDKKLLRETGHIDIETLAGWDELEELRRLCNAIKHAEGSSMAELRKNYPDLLNSPSLLHEIFPEISDLFASNTCNRAIRNSLVGDEIFVKDQDIDRYTAAIEDFWCSFVRLINDGLSMDKV